MKRYRLADGNLALNLFPDLYIYRYVNNMYEDELASQIYNAGQNEIGRNYSRDIRIFMYKFNFAYQMHQIIEVLTGQEKHVNL